jgi:predicted nucleotidyltransferase
LIHDFPKIKGGIVSVPTNGVNDLFMLVGIKNELEERLHRSVDIVTYRENMNQFLKKKIDGEAV